MFSRCDVLAEAAIRAGDLQVEPELGEVWRGPQRAEVLDRRTGYGRVQVYVRPQTYAMAHRVIWIARHGLIPRGLHVNHINRHRWDNRLVNLEVVTPTGNARHAHGHPYDACGPIGNLDAGWLQVLDGGDPPPERYDPLGHGRRCCARAVCGMSRRERGVSFPITVSGDLHIHVNDPTAITGPILAALAKTQGALMSEVDDQLAALSTQFDTFRADLDRELADFGNLVAGHLSPEQQAAFDALAAKFSSAQAAVDTADPATPPAA